MELIKNFQLIESATFSALDKIPCSSLKASHGTIPIHANLGDYLLDHKLVDLPVDIQELHISFQESKIVQP